jgi:hypothetical protein
MSAHHSCREQAADASALGKQLMDGHRHGERQGRRNGLLCGVKPPGAGCVRDNAATAGPAKTFGGGAG